MSLSAVQLTHDGHGARPESPRQRSECQLELPATIHSPPTGAKGAETRRRRCHCARSLMYYPISSKPWALVTHVTRPLSCTHSIMRFPSCRVQYAKSFFVSKSKLINCCHYCEKVPLCSRLSEPCVFNLECSFFGVSVKTTPETK